LPRDNSRHPKERPPAEILPALLSEPRLVVKLAIIGAVVLIIVGSLAYVAGWLSPGRLTPQRFVGGFEEANGVHPGFRRHDAESVCIGGYFESNGGYAPFRGDRVPELLSVEKSSTADLAC
jgi:hypothetical protein